MDEQKIASVELTAIINDTDAETLFARGGPLEWFSPKKTYAFACHKGALTDKQVNLVRSVYQQYATLKKVSREFSATGEGRNIATLLYRILRDKPKVETKEDRGRSQKLSHIIRAFSDGGVIHLGRFNAVEALVADLSIQDKTSVWEQLHSARRTYLTKSCDVRSDRAEVMELENR